MKYIYILIMMLVLSTSQAGVPDIIINEFQADPDATNGDANGDGVVSTTQDEFVELYNNSGADLDVSGWTVADGARSWYLQVGHQLEHLAVLRFR